jgi:hypothetical protein
MSAIGRSAFLGLLMFLLGASPARATPFFEAEVATLFGQHAETGSSAVSAASDVDVGTVAQTHTEAASSPATLGVSAMTHLQVSSTGANSGAGLIAQALARFDDVIFTGPPPPGGKIPVSLNLSLAGSMSAAPVANGTESATATSIAFLSVRVDVGGTVVGPLSSGIGDLFQLSGGTLIQGTITRTQAACVPPGVSPGGCAVVVNTEPSGFLFGLGTGNVFSGTVNTGLFDVPVNQPVSLGLLLLGNAQNAVVAVAPGDGLGGTASLDFLHDTLSFPAVGPVFDLPDGYTANSLEANITNNVSGTPGPPASSVPEPNSIVLCATAMSLLVTISVKAKRGVGGRGDGTPILGRCPARARVAVSRLMLPALTRILSL